MHSAAVRLDDSNVTGTGSYLPGATVVGEDLLSCCW